MNFGRVIITLIELNLFGYPSVWQNGEQITGFISEKAIALLIYVAETGETHARDYLTGLLWGDTDEKKAKASLRSALYNIGKLLPDVFDVTRKTVALAAELRSTTTQLRQHNDPTVYTADYLAGFYIPNAPEFEEWQLRQREQLRRMAVEAWQDRATIAEENGQNTGAITAWRELVKLEPWREEPHRHIMRLHARMGNYAAALRQFNICSEQLKEELGVEPMAQTAGLAQRIKAARSQPRDNLPVESVPFFGRTTLLTDLTTRIPNQRLLTLAAIGGAGKTRLSIALGRQLRHRFLNGVGFVQLAEVAPSNPRRSVVNAIITALTAGELLPKKESADPETWLIEQLAQREMLLILDNFEHLLDAALLLDRILTETKHVHLLVTSRERLRLRQEQVVLLGGLAYPESVDSAQVGATPSGQLFLTAAERIGATISDLSAVTTICQLVDGLPLALEMAAAWVDVESPAAIAATLADDLDLLQIDERNRPNRQRSMRTVFDYSWGKLTQNEQDCLRKLAVLHGVFSADAAQAIADADQRTLTRLVNKSLVQPVEDGKYRQHVLVRQFSTEKLDDDLPSIRQKHFDYFSNWLKTHYADKDARPTDVTQTVSVEFENIRSAWRYTIEQQDVSAMTDLLPNLARLVSHRTLFADLDEMVQQAQAVFEAKSAERRADWAHLLMMDSIAQIRTNRVWAGHQRALDARRIFLDLEQTDEIVRQLCTTTNLLCITCKARGDYQQGVEFGKESIRLHEQIGDNVGIVRPLSNLGSLYYLMGNFDESAELLTHALKLCRDSNNLDGTIHMLNNLGAMFFDRGMYERAETYFQEGLEAVQQLDRPINQMILLINLGHVAVVKERFTEALRFCERAHTLLEKTGDVRMGLEVFAIHARALSGLEQFTDATAQLRTGLNHARQMDVALNSLRLLTAAAELFAAQGLNVQASELFGYVLAHDSAALVLQRTAEKFLKNLPKTQPSDLSINDLIDKVLMQLSDNGER